MTYKRPNASGPRPQVWRSGPDPTTHKQYISWGRSRAQAHYRGEVWNLTFAQYQQLWKDCWHLRGRKGHDLCLTRINSAMPWSMENSTVKNRIEVLRAQGQARKQQHDKNQSSFISKMEKHNVSLL